MPRRLPPINAWSVFRGHLRPGHETQYDFSGARGPSAAIGVASAFIGVPGAVNAQRYPDRPIRFVVAYLAEGEKYAGVVKASGARAD